MSPKLAFHASPRRQWTEAKPRGRGDGDNPEPVLEVDGTSNIGSGQGAEASGQPMAKRLKPEPQSAFRSSSSTSLLSVVAAGTRLARNHRAVGS